MLSTRAESVFMSCIFCTGQWHRDTPRVSVEQQQELWLLRAIDVLWLEWGGPQFTGWEITPVPLPVYDWIPVFSLTFCPSRRVWCKSTHILSLIAVGMKNNLNIWHNIDFIFSMPNSDKCSCRFLIQSALYQVFTLSDLEQQRYGFINTGILNNDTTVMNQLTMKWIHAS